jgi:general secretion pathway protein D
LQTVLASQGDVEVVAAPELVALNNEPAVIRTGATENTGLTLTVVPQISADGIVQLSLSPSWTRTGAAVSRSGQEAVATDRADTVVRVMDGSTVMVSGLLHSGDRIDTATGLAGLFGAERHRRVTKELVVLLTPTVVNAAAGPVAAR